MRIYNIYPDYLDIGDIRSRNLIPRKCSIYEHYANAVLASSQYEVNAPWEQWGKELAKL